MPFSRISVRNIWNLSHNPTIKTTIKNFSSVIHKNIRSEHFLQIIIKVSVAEFVFSKIPYFQHILLEHLWTNAFELWKFFFQEHLILDIKTTFRLQKPHCKYFWWKHIKNENCKCYLGNKNQNAMLLVLSRSDVHFGFEHPFLCAWSGAQIKLLARKIGRLERNLSSPEHELKLRNRWSNFLI